MRNKLQQREALVAQPEALSSTSNKGSNKGVTMTASATLYDHQFTGDALSDFGLSAEDLVMTGVREDLDDFSTRSSTTETSTVVASNRHKHEVQPSTKSVAEGTIISSLDDDNSESVSTEALDGMLMSRIMLCVGLSLIAVSIAGGIIVWTMFPMGESGSPQYSQTGLTGLDISPPGSSVPNQPSDVFSNTDCPEHFHQSPPLPGKKGVVLSDDDSEVVNLRRILHLEPGWSYSVRPLPSIHKTKNVEYVPMVPAANDDADISQALIDLQIGAEPTRILGYYEPDGSDPNSLSVDTAVERWSLLEDFHVPLISPSTSDPMGMWMRGFMQMADDMCLRIDWIGLHWFGDVSFENFKSSMQQIYRLYGKRPLLLTELAVADWKADDRGFHRFMESDVLEFMKLALPWLEQQDWIAGYAWYDFDANHPAGGPSALFNATGGLTSVGQYYASVTKSNPAGNQDIA